MPILSKRSKAGLPAGRPPRAALASRDERNNIDPTDPDAAERLAAKQAASKAAVARAKQPQARTTARPAPKPVPVRGERRIERMTEAEADEILENDRIEADEAEKRPTTKAERNAAENARRQVAPAGTVPIARPRHLALPDLGVQQSLRALPPMKRVFFKMSVNIRWSSAPQMDVGAGPGKCEARIDASLGGIIFTATRPPNAKTGLHALEYECVGTWFVHFESIKSIEFDDDYVSIDPARRAEMRGR
jgi:hypothetical protein